MFKKIIMWLFFTLFAGILPLILKIIICDIAKCPFTYTVACSEIFFFNVILTADGMKNLYDMDSNKKLRILLFASSIFILIILSTIYGFLLLNDYIQGLNLNIGALFNYSLFFTALCVVINLCILLSGGADEDE